MGPVGVFTVAFITTFGGGTLRGIRLDKRPPLEVPMLFRDGNRMRFAPSSAAGCSCCRSISVWASATAITGMRLLTWKYEMRLGR